MKLPLTAITAFQHLIWNFYQEHQRHFPWRHCDDPYAIVVSEIMLQQTQTYRVEPKFEQWLLAFPNFQTLAQANLRDVLFVWQGLGYNRRGMALHKIAHIVMQNHQGQLPNDPMILETFPGIGKATAASICAFAFNSPTIFIETNIRAVFIHSFFKNQSDVADKQLLPLVEHTIDRSNPREWYYALMDYGVHLKKLHKNPSRRSAHHAKQSKFEGSDRQIRGAVIRHLTRHGPLSKPDLYKLINDDRMEKILLQLCSEQMIKSENDQFFID
jgi:A/G-specific adenine glycosylase